MLDFLHCVSTWICIFFSAAVVKADSAEGLVLSHPPSLALSLSLTCFLLLCRPDLTCRNSPDREMNYQRHPLSLFPLLFLYVWQTDADRSDRVIGLLHTNMQWTKAAWGFQRAHETKTDKHKHLSTPGMTHYRLGQHSGGELMVRPPPSLFPLLPLLFFPELSTATSAAGVRGGV